jgi:hypothetical protein
LGRPSNLLFFQLLLDGANLGQRRVWTAGHLPDAENAKWPKLKPGWIGILKV